VHRQRDQSGEDVHQQREEVADVAETADNAWMKLRFSQKMSTFTPTETARRSRKLRQIIQHWYMEHVHFGLVELRNVLASDPFSKAINSGEKNLEKSRLIRKNKSFHLAWSMN
jgi:hypothetical protein